MQGRLGPVDAEWGYRGDGSAKGKGHFGPLDTGEGDTVATELTVDATIAGKKMGIPLIVPTLTRDEINHLLSGGGITDDIYNKAVEFAQQRVSAGKSPYADGLEAAPLPQE